MSRVSFTGSTPNEYVIPVADGDFFTDEMSSDYGSCDFFIRFYSDAGVTPIEPTGGTVTFTSSPDEPDSVGGGDFRYYNVVAGSFAASTTDDTNRAQPNVSGTVVKARLNLSGIAGATHFRAWCVRR